MQISPPSIFKKEDIEIMTSSDDESVEFVSPSVGVAPFCDSEALLPSSSTGVCRPTESNGDGGAGGETYVGEKNLWREIWCGPAGLDGRDRTDDGGLADDFVWRYEG